MHLMQIGKWSSPYSGWSSGFRGLIVNLGFLLSKLVDGSPYLLDSLVSLNL
jgi:hypothetical protein